MARYIATRDMPPLCFTIAEFCASHRIGQSKYYELREAGLGPDEIRLGGKVLVTIEAAQRWRAARDAEAKRAQQDS